MNTDYDELPLFRYMNPLTSAQGAAHIRPKIGGQIHRLLTQYAQHPILGLTDEEASTHAGLERGGWKRCSDLRRLGFIETTGATRTATSGVEQRICRITEAGRQAIA